MAEYLKREHKLVWSCRYEQEHKAVMAECDRVGGIGGSFEIKNEFISGSWYTLVTIYYPKENHDQDVQSTRP